MSWGCSEELGLAVWVALPLWALIPPSCYLGIATSFQLARRDCFYKRMLKDSDNGNVLITGRGENGRGHTDRSGSTFSTVAESQAPNPGGLRSDI